MKKKTAKRSHYGARRPRERGPQETQFMVRLGETIKRLRTEAGMTGDQLARAVNIVGATQFHREAGRVSMPVEDLARYAAALGCKPADLVK